MGYGIWDRDMSFKLIDGSILHVIDQCWSGEVTSFYRHKPSESCLELGMQTCNQTSPAPCAGNTNSVFVYRL